MKIKSYLLAGLATFALASCDESFNDWAEQATNTQGDAVAFGNGAVKPVDLIDFANVPEGTDSVQVCEITTAPTSSNAAYAQSYSITYTYTYLDGTETKTKTSTLNMGSTGKVSFAEFKKYVEETYGKRPMERDLPAQAKVTFSNGATASYLTSENFTVKAKPVAPVIEEAYYYIGAANTWGVTNKDYKLTNSGKDVYEDPVFSVVIPAPKDADGKPADNWFKIAPASAYDLENLWDSPYMIGGPTNGTTDKKGTFVQGVNDVDAFAFNITDANAKYYKITIDLMNRTYEVTPLSFGEYFYEIGGDSGWKTTNALYGGNGDGKYQGFYYLNGEFKFKPQAGTDDWAGDYEFDGEGKIADNGNGKNCPDPGAGFYQIDVDLQAGTYALTKVNSITVVGNHNGWKEADANCHMKYNKEAGCWELTTELKDGFKFAMNDAWDISWGGANGDATAYDNISVNNGKDLNVPAGEGTYKIQLYLSHEGANKVVLTKQ